MSRRIRMVLLVAVVTAVLSPTAAEGSPPVGPVTIVTNIDFSTFPFNGPFTVPAGADLLGCSGGTFVDFPAGGFGASIDKVFTCTSGGSGAFVIRFRPLCQASFDPEAETCTGNWNVLTAFEDFAGLQGRGDFMVVFDPDEPAGVETLTGAIHYH